jgi:hypothetical protein
VDQATWLQQACIDQSMAERIGANAEHYHDTIYTAPFSEDELWTTASGVLQNCWDVAAGKTTWAAGVNETYAGDSQSGLVPVTRADTQTLIDFEGTVVCPMARPEPSD